MFKSLKNLTKECDPNKSWVGTAIVKGDQMKTIVLFHLHSCAWLTDFTMVLCYLYKYPFSHQFFISFFVTDNLIIFHLVNAILGLRLFLKSHLSNFFY